MDVQVGDVLKALEAVGQAGRTAVMLTSEQGGQWPGAEWTNWEQGLRTDEDPDRDVISDVPLSMMPLPRLVHRPFKIGSSRRSQVRQDGALA